MVELAEMRSLKINLLVYNPKLKQLEEIWTDEQVRFDHVKGLIETARHAQASGLSRRSALKFKSSYANLKYKNASSKDEANSPESGKFTESDSESEEEEIKSSHQEPPAKVIPSKKGQRVGEKSGKTPMVCSDRTVKRQRVEAPMKKPATVTKSKISKPATTEGIP